MRIALVSDQESTGGAAIAATRLADSLRAAGHEVGRFIYKPDAGAYSSLAYRLSSDRRDTLGRRVMRRFGAKNLLERWDERAIISRFEAAVEDFRPDIINVHNVHGMGSPLGLLDACCRSAPTAWTLHDMWSFTGRCAYSYDCDRFILGCDSTCPTPDEYPALAPVRIKKAWQRRQQLFAAWPDLIAVTPSRWLEKRALSALWRNHRVEHIPNGLPLDVYRPEIREPARKALDLPTGEGPVLLAVAENFTERRKGALHLTEMLRLISERPLTLLTLGAGEVPVDARAIKVHRLGYVDNPRTQVLAYNAADLFVHPAPVDNLPNVVMEAIACGTPAVAFPIGGLVDLVRPGLTGWLAEEATSASLAKATDTALRELANGIDLRSSCRGVAVAEYSVEQQAVRYLRLFDSMLAKKGTGSPRPAERMAAS